MCVCKDNKEYNSMDINYILQFYTIKNKNDNWRFSYLFICSDLINEFLEIERQRKM